jgi:hypothetical protein
VLAPVDPPWYVGTAAYPADAVIHEVPEDVIASHGRIFWVADPGVDPPTLPSGYRATASHCAVLACLTVYEATATGP